MLRFNQLKILSLIFGISLLASCHSSPQLANKLKEGKDIKIESPVVKTDPQIYRTKMEYHIDSLESNKEIDSLFASYEPEEVKTILALNRMDKNRLRPGKKIIVPECASAQFIDYSPFPQDLDFMKCIPKVVLISQRVQAFGLYENGDLVKWGPVSTGKSSTRTPNGLNYGNYKAKRKVSTVDASWIMPYYFNFMNFEGIGTHEYALPGYPASHGCVRMYRDDAKYIFDWAEMWEIKNSRIVRNGTPFMVFGNYEFGGELPWLNLAQNMKANDLRQEEIDVLKSYVDEYNSDPRNFSQGLDKEQNNILAQS